MSSVNWVDLTLAGVLLASVVLGFVRGFVFEVLSLLGWFVAYFAAQWLVADVAPHVPVGAPGSGINHAASFTGLFVLALLAWGLSSQLLRLLIRATPLSLPDRLLGSMFGLLRAAVLLLAVATVVSLTPAANSAAWRTSVGAEWLQSALSAMRPFIPATISQHLPAPDASR